MKCIEFPIDFCTFSELVLVSISCSMALGVYGLFDKARSLMSICTLWRETIDAVPSSKLLISKQIKKSLRSSLDLKHLILHGGVSSPSHEKTFVSITYGFPWQSLSAYQVAKPLEVGFNHRHQGPA